MARRPRGGRRDEIARAILEEFGVETADEAQEALRQILGESTPIPLTTFTPPWGGCFPWANWPSRTPPG